MWASSLIKDNQIIFYFIFYFCYALTNIVLTGNGQQQFISIPVSLATGGNQQIQLLTTSNGQIIATNLASIPGLTQPLNLNVNSNSK